MSFENLIGNDKIKEALNKSIKVGNIMHSYMFIGPSGIGKSLFAKEFAKMILCQSDEKVPCNNCKSCIEIENNNNPDLVSITSTNGSIKIETIRQMQEKVLEKPIISSKKVYIIKDADLMTKEAQNCLLKTLEEPPAFVIIILTGTNESNFLNTIKSRCMKITFSKIQDDILKNFLIDNYNIILPDDLLKASYGSIEKAIFVNSKKEEFSEISKIFGNIEKYTLLDVINNLDFIYQNKDDIFEILDYINIILSRNQLNNTKYIKYIEVIEKTKNNLKANANFDMSIDNMLYNIWEE